MSGEKLLAGLGYALGAVCIIAFGAIVACGAYAACGWLIG